jgi:hypothetical protein
MVWETNVWSLLEEYYGWRPDWFKADHNDSIIHIPDIFSNEEIPQQQTPISHPSYTPPFDWPIK